MLQASPALVTGSQRSRKCKAFTCHDRGHLTPKFCCSALDKIARIPQSAERVNGSERVTARTKEQRQQQRSLDTNHAQIARLHLGELEQRRGHKWHQIFNGIRVGTQQHNAKRALTQILLIAQILIDSHKRIKIGRARETTRR